MTEMYKSRQRPGSKPTESRVIIAVIAYLMAIDTSLLPPATLMVYSLRLFQSSRNITTAMEDYISSMMKKGMRYGG